MSRHLCSVNNASTVKSDTIPLRHMVSSCKYCTTRNGRESLRRSDQEHILCLMFAFTNNLEVGPLLPSYNHWFSTNGK